MERKGKNSDDLANILYYKFRHCSRRNKSSGLVEFNQRGPVDSVGIKPGQLEYQVSAVSIFPDYLLVMKKILGTYELK